MTLLESALCATGSAHKYLHKCASLGGRWIGESDVSELVQFGGVIVLEDRNHCEEIPHAG